jgi:prepilin peptidase CpaA
MVAMDKLFSWQNWPVLVVCLAMLASAVIDWWKFKVPNWLTLPVILSGWVLGGLYDLGVLEPALNPGGPSRLAASLLCTFGGGIVLYLLWSVNYMGAGDAKMGMGFGAWVGSFYGLNGNLCLVILSVAFVIAILVGGLIAVVMILVRGQFRQNMQNVRDIMTDWLKSGSSVAQRAAERKARMQRLPYGVPLCIGFVGYLLYLYTTGGF